MLLLEVHAGLFDRSFRLPAPEHSGWRLLTACEHDLPPSSSGTAVTREQVVAICPLLYEATDFGREQFSCYQKLMQKVTRVATAGLDWKRAMGDDVHDAGDVLVTLADGRQQKHTIVQFGLMTTLVRVHAVTTAGGRKVAFLTHSFVKPANRRKVPPSEQTRAAQILQRYVRAVNDGSAQLIRPQGGRNGFLKLF